LTVTFRAELVTAIPIATVPGPAERPPSVKLLRSRTTLLAWISMARPDVIEVLRFPVKP